MLIVLFEVGIWVSYQSVHTYVCGERMWYLDICLAHFEKVHRQKWIQNIRVTCIITLEEALFVVK